MTADATDVVKRRSMAVSEKRTCTRTENRTVQEERRAFRGRGAASEVLRGSDGLDLSHDGAYSLGTEWGEWAGDTGHRLWKSCYRDMKPDCSQSAVFSSPTTSPGFRLSKWQPSFNFL